MGRILGRAPSTWAITVRARNRLIDHEWSRLVDDHRPRRSVVDRSPL